MAITSARIRRPGASAARSFACTRMISTSTVTRTRRARKRRNMRSRGARPSTLPSTKVPHSPSFGTDAPPGTVDDRKRSPDARKSTTAFAGIAADAGASGQPPPLPPIRPPLSLQTQPGGATPASPRSSIATPLVPQPADAAACLAGLRTIHIEAEIVPAPPAPLADCEIAEPVRLSSIGLTNGATIDLPNRPILDCTFAITFTEFARDLMGAPCHGDARLGHRRARDRRLLMPQLDPASERQSEPACHTTVPTEPTRARARRNVYRCRRTRLAL